jgi:hypothetical protein
VPALRHGTLRHCWACLYRDISLSNSSQDVQSVPLVTNVLCKCMIAMSSRELAKPDTWTTGGVFGCDPDTHFLPTYDCITVVRFLF